MARPTRRNLKLAGVQPSDLDLDSSEFHGFSDVEETDMKYLQDMKRVIQQEGELVVCPGMIPFLPSA